MIAASIIAVRQIEATRKMPLHPLAAFYLLKSIYSNWKHEQGQGIPLTQQPLLKRKYFILDVLDNADTSL